MTITRGPNLAAVAVVTAALGVALFLFQPWTVFVDEQVSEALPVAAPSDAEGGPGPACCPASAGLRSRP